MVSREAKTRFGKVIMLVSFLHILSLLTVSVTTLPSPTHIPIKTVASLLGFTVESVQIGLSGLLGFILFGLGYELWDRNRKSWNEI